MVLLAAYLPASGLAILHCTALALTSTNHLYTRAAETSPQQLIHQTLKKN